MRIDWLSPCRLRNGYLQRCGTTALSKKTRAEVVLAVIWTPGQARPWKENEKPGGEKRSPSRKDFANPHRVLRPVFPRGD